MASKQETLNYVVGQLDGMEEISWRKMMGEYVIYYKGKVVAGIYDNRFLVKRTPKSVLLLPDAVEEVSYEGAKKMLSLSDIIFAAHKENGVLVKKVFEAVYEDLGRKLC